MSVFSSLYCFRSSSALCQSVATWAPSGSPLPFGELSTESVTSSTRRAWAFWSSTLADQLISEAIAASGSSWPAWVAFKVAHEAADQVRVVLDHLLARDDRVARLIDAIVAIGEDHGLGAAVGDDLGRLVVDAAQDRRRQVLQIA